MQVLKAVSALEERLLALMQTEDPDADDGKWVELDVRRVAQNEKRGVGSHPDCDQGSHNGPFIRRQGACRRPRIGPITIIAVSIGIGTLVVSIMSALLSITELAM